MPVQTIYVLATTAVTPNWWGNTQLNGSAPTAANTAFGYLPATNNVTTAPYYRGRLGASGVQAATLSTSWNAGTTGPTPGTGSAATTAGDSFIAGPFTGTFLATAWSFAWNLRASTAGAVGHVNMRIWKSANANGSSPTQLLANTAGTTVTLSTTADVNSSISWSPGALTLNNEYLFFQVEWQETVAGVTNSNVLFRAGTAAITTPNLLAAVTGTLTANQDANTLAGAASTNLAYGRGLFGVLAYNRPTAGFASGGLAVTQANETIAAAGTVAVGGALNVPQAPQTLAAAGVVRVGATLTATQANETLVAAGGPRVGAVLTALQDPQTLASTGTVRVGATLSANQAPQTLAGAGIVVSGMVGNLTVTQAPQTLAAAATVVWPPAYGTLGITQDDQALAATAESYWQPVAPAEPGEWPVAPPCDLGDWFALPLPVATVGFGRYGYGANTFGITRAVGRDLASVGFGRYGFGAGPFGITAAISHDSIIGTWQPANDCNASAWQSASGGNPGAWKDAA